MVSCTTCLPGFRRGLEVNSAGLTWSMPKSIAPAPPSVMEIVTCTGTAGCGCGGSAEELPPSSPATSISPPPPVAGALGGGGATSPDANAAATSISLIEAPREYRNTEEVHGGSYVVSHHLMRGDLQEKQLQPHSYAYSAAHPWGACSLQIIRTAYMSFFSCIIHACVRRYVQRRTSYKSYSVPIG